MYTNILSNINIIRATDYVTDIKRGNTYELYKTIRLGERKRERG